MPAPVLEVGPGEVLVGELTFFQNLGEPQRRRAHRAGEAEVADQTGLAPVVASRCEAVAAGFSAA